MNTNDKRAGAGAPGFPVVFWCCGKILKKKTREMGLLWLKFLVCGVVWGVGILF
jgi:hypothetical protein